ncbi:MULTISPECIES: hypothetical protein [Cutibacterium]|uniref:Uncharacterized protein n=1 Tax=Cutibacterium acnes TaxID=1747 RepID=A0A2B7ID19_CUTAC|nr:hypothetical protein [Cutibacterium acnes]EFS36944.1 hypothetical protein HMPREF9567_00296 [Cutibacterium acnes HL013PA1]EFS38838.1 hypothetical protein HMPREF9574_00868 [Cutibacterium acnes HL074PA1]EFS41174.1 hypothetical protein HMPREF9575_01202 [Cutibacterium acnes HL110PA1]EFS44967.1 hypothetical protein HMPREF9580_02228 [Cutibacterium acnes HL087PA2]EFS48725.1 hypothetical protein HMPREF9585_01079 [Cutibacterium acnes HL083PA1]EFS55042.1 hypothetical protein HMPREF9593_02390 [Cutibac
MTWRPPVDTGKQQSPQTIRSIRGHITGQAESTETDRSAATVNPSTRTPWPTFHHCRANYHII